MAGQSPENRTGSAKKNARGTFTPRHKIQHFDQFAEPPFGSSLLLYHAPPYAKPQSAATNFR